MGLAMYSMCAAAGLGCFALNARFKPSPMKIGMTSLEAWAAVLAFVGILALVVLPW